MFNMFRALLCISSGANDYSADYHVGRPVLGLLLVGSSVQAGYSLQPGHLSSLPAPNFQQQPENWTAYVVISTIVVSS